MIIWYWYKFSELSLDQLYDVMSLREQVFTHEQHCTETDLDGLDKQALHLIGTQDDELIAYARVLPKGVYYKDAIRFGRLVIPQEYRGKGLGKQMMQEIVNYIAANYPKIPVKFSAQLYLRAFYEGFGFHAAGDTYDEGGIPHIKMEN